MIFRNFWNERNNIFSNFLNGGLEELGLIRSSKIKEYRIILRLSFINFYVLFSLILKYHKHTTIHTMCTMHRVSRRYFSTTGWISTSALGKRRGVRRRGRNERLVLDVCRSFFCFPFLFLPSPTRSRGTVLFRRFYLRGNFKGDGQQTCDPFWHTDDVATPTKTHSLFLSSFRIALASTTRWTFLLPIVFARRLLFRNLAFPCLSVNPFLSSPFTPFRSVFRVPTSIFNGPVTLPGNDIRPIFHGIRIPSSIFQCDPRRGLQCFPVLPGKANKRVDRAAWWNANPTCRWKFFWKWKHLNAARPSNAIRNWNLDVALEGCRGNPVGMWLVRDVG